MHYKTITAAILTVVVMGTTLPVQAATTYHRTKTVKVSHKAYYAKRQTGKTYTFSGSTKRFKMKANHALKNYQKTTWTRSKQTYVTKKGKKYLYYYVTNAKNNAKGWVYAKYLKAGKNYQGTSTKKTAKKAYYRAKSAKLVNLTGHNSYLKIINGAALKKNLTYNRSKQRDVYINGKKSRYYYVTSADGKAKGWIKPASLKAGRDYQMTTAKKQTAANYIMAKAGKVYTITGNNDALKFSNGHALDAKTNYTATQSRTIYLKNKKHTYYLISNTNGSVNGWVNSKYIKTGKHSTAPTALNSGANSSSAIVKSSSSSVTVSSSSAAVVTSSSSSAVANSSSASSTAPTTVDPFSGESKSVIYTSSDTYLYKTSDLRDSDIVKTVLKSNTRITVYPYGINQNTFVGYGYSIPVIVNHQKLYMRGSFSDLISDNLYPDGYYHDAADFVYDGVVKPTDPSVQVTKPFLDGTTWIYHFDGGLTVYVYKNGTWSGTTTYNYQFD